MKLGFSEALLFNTVHIIATDKNGDTVTGTSFLFEFKLGNAISPDTASVFFAAARLLPCGPRLGNQRISNPKCR
jgi:hypothetical protein